MDTRQPRNKPRKNPNKKKHPDNTSNHDGSSDAQAPAQLRKQPSLSTSMNSRNSKNSRRSQRSLNNSFGSRGSQEQSYQKAKLEREIKESMLSFIDNYDFEKEDAVPAKDARPADGEQPSDRRPLPQPEEKAERTQRKQGNADSRRKHKNDRNGADNQRGAPQGHKDGF